MIVTPANPKELEQAQKFDLEKNDAEIIDQAERAQGRRFTNLDKDSYPRKSISVKPRVSEVKEYGGWREGQIVELRLDNPLGIDRVRGPIEAITEDGEMLRVSGRLYPAKRAVRCFV